MELTAAQRIAHAAALEANPGAHPTDCNICAHLTQENAVPAEDLATITAERDAARTAAAEAQAELEKLKTAQAGSAVDTAVAAAVAAKETEIDQLNAKLGAETSRADAAEQALDAYKTEVADAEAQRLEDERLAGVKEQRVAALAGLLSDERITARADYYAGLADADWAEQLEDLRANAKQEVKPPAGTIPGASAAVSLGTSTGAASTAAAQAAAGGVKSGLDASRAIIRATRNRTPATAR